MKDVYEVGGIHYTGCLEYNSACVSNVVCECGVMQKSCHGEQTKSVPHGWQGMIDEEVS